MSRLNPRDRKAAILSAAMQQARDVGYQTMTREGIAKVAGCSDALVSAYFNTMTQMRRAVVRNAIVTQDLPVLAQALVLRDPQAMKAPEELRRAAAAQVGRIT